MWAKLGHKSNDAESMQNMPRIMTMCWLLSASGFGGGEASSRSLIKSPATPTVLFALIFWSNKQLTLTKGCQKKEK
jgi:hypothetical protein